VIRRALTREFALLPSHLRNEVHESGTLDQHETGIFKFRFLAVRVSVPDPTFFAGMPVKVFEAFPHVFGQAEILDRFL
jgi:hypothetical protein